MARRGRTTLTARQRRRTRLEEHRHKREAREVVLRRLQEHDDHLTQLEAHAGYQIIQLRELGMTLTELSEITGLSTRRLNQLIATCERVERDTGEEQDTTPPS